MKEKDFWKKIREELKERKCYFYKAVDRTNAGIPDIIICNRGTFLCIELKVDYNKTTDMQMYLASQIINNGGRFFILTYHNTTKTCSLQEVMKDWQEDIGHFDNITIETALNLMGLKCAVKK
jgi:hypothetical protein